MGEDKCPFCGAGLGKQHNGWDRLKCESIRYNSDGTFETFYNRTNKCYETQLTTMTRERDAAVERLVEAEGLLRQAKERMNNLSCRDWLMEEIDAFLAALKAIEPGREGE